MYLLTNMRTGTTMVTGLWEMEANLHAWFPRVTPEIRMTICKIRDRLSYGKWDITRECIYLGIQIEMHRPQKV